MNNRIGFFCELVVEGGLITCNQVRIYWIIGGIRSGGCRDVYNDHSLLGFRGSCRVSTAMLVHSRGVH